MNEMQLTQAVASARGLLPEDAATVRELVRLWLAKRPRNALRDRYYLSHVRIKDLGISIPPNLVRLIDPRVSWPHKAVNCVVDRSQFDGFVSDDDAVQSEIQAICDANQLKELYRKNAIGELVHCCGFWTVTADPADKAKPVVSAYPATAACALWDDSLKSIAAGLAVAESKKQPGSSSRVPTLVRVFLPDWTIELRRGDRGWQAEYLEQGMGRPVMEPMANEPTLERPFGRSRITRTVMSLTDDMIRHQARMEVAAESSAMPQMWLLGTAKRMIADGNRYDATIGALNEVTKDVDGDAPSIWQSAQLSFQPMADYARVLASQLSAETGVPMAELGVLTDNPASAEGIDAAKEPLVIAAQNLNDSNGRALRNVALMALAVARGTSFAEQRDAGYSLMARWRNPAMPSVVSQSDAMVKQISAIPWLADSDVALEELGYSEDKIARLRSDKRRSQARSMMAQAARQPAATPSVSSSQPVIDDADQ